jgi:hypothetical protein
MELGYSLWMLVSITALNATAPAAEPNVFDLDGRKVVIRQYECGSEDPTAFTKTTVLTSGDRLLFDMDQTNGNTFLVIFGIDQHDEMIKQLLGDCIYAWSYNRDLSFPLLRKASKGSKTGTTEQYVTGFVDGLGKPVRDATVDIYLFTNEKRVLIDRQRLNSNGELDRPLRRRNVSARATDNTVGFWSAAFFFRISHHGYGSAFVMPDIFSAEQTYVVPLVPLGSEPDTRSAWGKVVDPNGIPVSGVTVYGIAIVTAGGDWIRSISGQKQGVITDEAGRFRMYLPPAEQAYQVGLMVPPKTEYQVHAKPPGGLHLLPAMTRVMNGEHATIDLEYAGYFHTFAFEDEKGLIADPDILREIRVVVRRSRQRNDLRLGYQQWRDGAWLPLGRYEATHEQYRWQEIQATTDSEPELVFRPQPSKIYVGRVINGVTGQAMPQAFVAATERCSHRPNLTCMSARDWQDLHRWQGQVPRGDADLRATLRKAKMVFHAQAVVRTDDAGRFEIKAAPNTNTKIVIAFEQDYLPFFAHTADADKEHEGKWQMGVLKLFPAGTVIFRPDYTVDANSRSVLGLPRWFLVGQQWFVDTQPSPGWAEELLAACGREADEGVYRADHLEVQRRRGEFMRRRFLVPAGVTLQINLRPLDNIEWAPITIAEDLKLQQGQTVDLGTHEMCQPFAVFVEVLNSKALPVEGVPVVVSGGYDPAISSTDEQGVAIFEFVGYSKGEFIVQYRWEDSNRPALRQTIPYEIAGVRDANSTFTINVSDQMLDCLYSSKRNGDFQNVQDPSSTVPATANRQN